MHIQSKSNLNSINIQGLCNKLKLWEWISFTVIYHFDYTRIILTCLYCIYERVFTNKHTIKGILIAFRPPFSLYFDVNASQSAVFVELVESPGRKMISI